MCICICNVHTFIHIHKHVHVYTYLFTHIHPNIVAVLTCTVMLLEDTLYDSWAQVPSTSTQWETKLINSPEGFMELYSKNKYMPKRAMCSHFLTVALCMYVLSKGPS